MISLILLVPAAADEERDAVALAWEATGGQVLRLDRFWEPPPLDASRVRLYGNTTFCLVLEQKLGLTLRSPADDWLVSTGAPWLKRDLEVLPLEAASARMPRFVKPLVPKLFRAGIYDRDGLLEETRGLPAGTACLVAEPVTFTAEARCLVLADEVLDAAVYEGVASRDDALRFAQSSARACPLDAPAALDVGFIEGRGWAVIEANPAWSAGLNGCRPDAMVRCLSAATTNG